MQILEHDPSLTAERPARLARTTVQPRRRRTVAIAAAAAGIAAAAAVWLAAGTPSPRANARATEVPEGLVAVEAGTGRFGKSIALDVMPAALIAAARSLWVADPNGGAILRVDPIARSAVDRIPIEGAPGALTAGADSIWVATAQRVA